MAGSASCSRAGATFTRTITSAMPNSQLASQNWEDFNYPPLLHLWHYAPDELEQGPRFVARTLHAALLLAINMTVQSIFLWIIMDPKSELTTSDWNNGTVAQLAIYLATVAP